MKIYTKPQLKIEYIIADEGFAKSDCSTCPVAYDGVTESLWGSAYTGRDGLVYGCYNGLSGDHR